MVRKLFTSFFALLFLVMASAAFAGEKVSKAKHPNLAAAQKLIKQAIAKLTASQKANEYKEGGNASKAKELLQEAYNLCKEAAKVDNANAKSE